MSDRTDTPAPLDRSTAEVVAGITDRLGTRSRMIVAIAGAPASGKSTLAAAVVDVLTARGISAVVVPMDGFHLDNRLLDARGLRPRKGAPETFDALGFVHMISRLGSGGEEVVIPGFDRSRDISIAGADVVGTDTRVLVVEGNYLLFDEDPWRQLAPLWDLSVRLDVGPDELRRRLIDRWLSYGLLPDAATARAESNDLPNARRVLDKSLPADIVISGLLPT